MGRRAGVTAEQTKTELLAAAARVFAHKGYDGASIADITAEAGLSSGAIYAHYDGKAELFAAVLATFGGAQLDHLVGGGDVRDIAEFVEAVGSTYDEPERPDAALIVEAIVASKRDPDVARFVHDLIAASEALMTASVAQGQQSGVLDDALSAEAIGRFTTTVALGAALTASLDLPRVDHEEWAALIHRLVDAIRPG